MTATARESANDLFGKLADAMDAAYDEIDRLRARVAELEGPALTDEQKNAQLALADRLDHAADVLVGERKSPYGSVDQSAGLLFASLVGHIRSADVQLSATLLRRANLLATALLGEDTDRG